MLISVSHYRQESARDARRKERAEEGGWGSSYRTRGRCHWGVVVVLEP